MAQIDKVNRAQEKQDNEFYTKYNDVQFYVENTAIKEYLNNKTVYLPCDTEDSQIYKYLMDNKEKFNIKEILHTSDDYYGHADLYQKCDLVLTNPPFTGLTKWINWLNTNNLKFIIWVPMMSISLTYRFCDSLYYLILDKTDTILYNSQKLYRGKQYYNFTSPTGDKQVAIYLVTNDIYFKDKTYTNIGDGLQKTLNEVKDKLYVSEEGYYCTDYARYLPYDYYDPIYMPVTSYIDRKSLYEFISKKELTCKDGKKRYRVLAKLKR